MSKPKSYHFDLGNSTNGPVGFCARVTAKSAKEAVKKLQSAIDSINAEFDVTKGAGLRHENPDLEYLEVYFNAEKISEKDIDEVNPAEEREAS